LNVLLLFFHSLVPHFSQQGELYVCRRKENSSAINEERRKVENFGRRVDAEEEEEGHITHSSTATRD